MRSVLFVLAALVVEAPAAKSAPTLESVYGELSDESKAVRAKEWLAAFEPPNQAAHADNSKSVEGDCDVDFDVLLLQEATAGFDLDFEVTANSTLGLVKEYMKQIAPGSAFSLMTFRDKPLPDLGEATDDCFTVQRLNAEDPTEFSDVYRAETARGGNDILENQFGALVAALKSPSTIPWHTNKTRIGLIFVITDSFTHWEGDDRAPLDGPLAPFGDEPYDEHKAEEYCEKRHYPSLDVVRNALFDEKVYLGVGVMRYDSGPALNSWKYFSNYVGYPVNLARIAAGGVRGWHDAFFDVVNTIYSEWCGHFPLLPSNGPAPPATEEIPPIDEVTPPIEEVVPPTGKATPPIQEVVPPTGEVTRPIDEIVPPESTEFPGGNDTQVCDCQPEGKPDPCCHRQPEVLIQIMKQPEELDIHFNGFQQESSGEEAH